MGRVQEIDDVIAAYMALLHIGFAKCETIELICHGGGIDGFSTTSESRWRCWVLRDNRGHTCMGCTSSITGWKRVYRWRQCRVNGSSGCPSWWVLGFETTGHMWMGKKCDGRGSGRVCRTWIVCKRNSVFGIPWRYSSNVYILQFLSLSGMRRSVNSGHLSKWARRGVWRMG